MRVQLNRQGMTKLRKSKPTIDMKRKITIKIIASTLLLSFVSLLYSDGKVSMRTNLFSDNQGTTIHIPSIEFNRALLTNVKLVLEYSLNQVIIPPVRGISASPSPTDTDAITGASRPVSGDDPANKSFTKDRNEIVAGLSLPNLGASYYYSNESDYLARMATVSTNFDLNQKNTNVAASYSYGWDDIKPLGTDTLLTKIAHTANVTLTQVLSPTLIARMGGNLTYIDGFQSNPYRTVHAAGQILLENHPLQRSRAAVFFKLNRYFKTRTSLNMEYRYYQDDWGIRSHTLGASYYQYFSEKVLFRYRYRYYDQTAASFYRPRYGAVQSFMTSDYKLQPFTAHQFGFKIEYKMRDLLKDGMLSFMANSTFEAKYERYFSSNDFNANIFQFGLILNY